MSISTPLSDAAQQHPKWCAAVPPMCTAYDLSEDADMRQHVGPTFTFTAPTFVVDLHLVQHNLDAHSAPYLIVVLGAPDGVDDSWGVNKAGATLSLDDAWSILDLASGLLEQVR